jgi:anti-sigma-K factor RskA
MTCEELRNDYGAWALGTAEEPERSEISLHLDGDCDACRRGVRSAMLTVANLAVIVKPVDPPKSLRRRIIAMVSPEPARNWFAVAFPWAVAATLGIALLVVSVRKLNTSGPQFEEALSILNDPVTRDASFGDPAARGRFYVSPTKGVLFIAAHLPKLDAGRTFEMWIIPASGNPIPAGTFSALADSTAIHLRPGPAANAAAMAISVEPSGGSAQPTTTPIIVTKLQALS